MSKTHIRPMSPEDIPDVTRMIHALNAFHNVTGHVTQSSLARDTDPANPWFYVYVAEQDGALVGYMILIRLAKVANGLRGLDINHMFVAESHRGTGIARQFVEAAKTKARDLSCSYVFISTAPDNTAAQDAYIAIGFAPFPDSGGPRFRMQL